MSIKEFGVKMGRKLTEAKPDILFYGGCALLLTGTVLACKKTLNLEKIVDEKTYEVDRAKEDHEMELTTDKEYKKQLVKSYAGLAWDLTKNYALPAAVIGVGFAGVGVAHSSLKKDKKELLATVATLDAAYERTRNKIEEKLGREEANDIYQGKEFAKEEKEDGTVKEGKRQVNAPNDITAICFSEEMCPDGWTKSPILRRNTLSGLLRFAQERYDARGYIFMYEIAEALGMRLEKGEYPNAEFHKRGWVKGHGHDYIDFGLDDPTNLDMQDFLDGYSDAVWLHFNDCGNILRWV